MLRYFSQIQYQSHYMLEAYQFFNFSLIVYKMRMTNSLEYKQCFSKSGLLFINPSLLTGVSPEQQKSPPNGVEFQETQDVPQMEHSEPSVSVSVKIRV